MKKTILFSVFLMIVWAIQAVPQPTDNKSITSVVVTPDTRLVGVGNHNELMMRVLVNYTGESVGLTSLTLNMDGSSHSGLVDQVKVYSTGSTGYFDGRTLTGATLLGNCVPGSGDFVCPLQGSLVQGANYLWITVDIADAADEGEVVVATLKFVNTAEENYAVSTSAGSGMREIILRRTVIYRPGDYNSTNYRIPAVITASDGSIVVATDKRKYNENDLPEDIDIICNRSTDGGRTWSEPVTIAQGTGYAQGFGDCALARTNEDNTLIAAFVGGVGLWNSTPSNPMRSYISKSYNNGLTWSTPVDITHFIFGSDCDVPAHRNWRGSFFGSGNGLLTSTGRIIFVAAIRENSAYSLNNYAVYSDDNGQTWHVSGRASVGGDEAKVTELIDGRILMSIRHNGERWYNISEDGGETWQPTTSSWSDLIAPACNGDLIRYTTVSQGLDKNRLLHSLPRGTERTDVTVYVSYDEGSTWPASKCIVPYASAYSSLCVLPDGTIGLYVEEKYGEETGYSTVYYNFSLEWLTDGADVWTPTSLADYLSDDDSLTLYPVPATSTITILADNAKTIRVFDAQGQLIKALTVDERTNIYLDISTLTPGLYVVESIDKDGVRKTGRFVKK
ncbi:MAG: exo-alpha-sialidase [Bacteroidales bacterium]|nr:exo-alpha-sialidase [Bacteroidales bacterium]